MKGIGIGEYDFKSLIKEDCLFVDKSLFIEDVLKDKSKVKLFLRPLCFGKSLNLSIKMIEALSLNLNMEALVKK